MIRNEVLLKSEIYYEFIKDRYEISLEILLIIAQYGTLIAVYTNDNKV